MSPDFSFATDLAVILFVSAVFVAVASRLFERKG
jgi:hypothetical protein